MTSNHFGTVQRQLPSRLRRAEPFAVALQETIRVGFTLELVRACLQQVRCNCFPSILAQSGPAGDRGSMREMLDSDSFVFCLQQHQRGQKIAMCSRNLAGHLRPLLNSHACVHLPRKTVCKVPSTSDYHVHQQKYGEQEATTFTSCREALKRPLRGLGQKGA